MKQSSDATAFPKVITVFYVKHQEAITLDVFSS